MKKVIFLIAFVLIFLNLNAQVEPAFEDGEWLKFRLHYGLVNAGYATLEVKTDQYKGKNVYHIIGKGKTVGMFNWFFKVDDDYQTYIDKKTQLPYKFIRNVYEGGYTINRIIDFDQKENKVNVWDKKPDKRSEITYDISENTLDMISVFYKARAINFDELKVGSKTEFNVFLDYELYKFSLEFLGKDTIETKFGDIACLKFVPLVQSGRVFKKEEGVTLWVSDDKNKVPIRMKSDLRVGSIKMDLHEYKGLKHSFEVLYKK